VTINESKEKNGKKKKKINKKMNETNSFYKTNGFKF